MALNSSPVAGRALSRFQFPKPSNVRHYSAPVSGTIPAAKQKYVPTSGTYPKGFKVSGTYVGVKASNTSSPDLAFLASDTPCSARAVFTKNRFQAAPVIYSRERLEARNNAGIQSVIINSGCANAVTGKGGLEDAAAMAAAADKALGFEDDKKGGRSLVMSTGVIGQRLPIDKILAKIPTAHSSLGDTHEHWLEAAKAICTTDTFPKLRSRTFSLPSYPDVEFRIAGMTKGAGMIHPNMATLLGVMATDAPVAPVAMTKLLQKAVNYSFNSISIDGDTSTNDTVALFANGAAAPGAKLIYKEKSEDFLALQEVVSELALDLAKLVVRDGEGATKFVKIHVANCRSEGVGHRVANAVAKSPLVKTALYGKDANWGRILCAVGYSHVAQFGEFRVKKAELEIDPSKVSVSFIPTDGSPELKLLVNGEPETVDEARAAEILQHEDLEIKIDLGNGDKSHDFYTCDFSHEYVTINGDYRT